MNIHLIRSSGFAKESYKEVVDLLQQLEGPLQFIASDYDPEMDEKKIWRKELDEEAFGKKKIFEIEGINNISRFMAPMEFPVDLPIASVKDLLAECTTYRRLKDLGDEEFVILLTHLGNELNWFSYGADDANDIFIHTDGWQYFVSSDLRFPLVHQVVSNILQKLMFGQMSKLDAAVHRQSRGCINDFCEHKKDISLKMRTGDICHDCQGILQEEKVSPGIINQVLNINESIRTQMLFKERFKYNLQPSHMEVRSIDRRIYLTDLEDFMVKLTPLERTVYLFFLNHPEGIYLNSLFEHKKEFDEIYGWLSTAATGNTLAKMKNRIEDLVNTGTENSVHEKISKANKKFVNAVGEDMAQHYKILKDPKTERYRIALDRKLLSYASSVRYSRG